MAAVKKPKTRQHATSLANMPTLRCYPRPATGRDPAAPNLSTPWGVWKTHCGQVTTYRLPGTIARSHGQEGGAA